MSRQPVGAPLAPGLPSPNLLSPSVLLHLPHLLYILPILELIHHLLSCVWYKITIASSPASFFVNLSTSSSSFFPLNPLTHRLPPYLLYILHILLLSISTFLILPALCYPDQPSTLLSSLLLSFSARILFTSVLLITGRASLDLTDVAIIQGISGLNTRAYLGSFPDGLAAKAPSAPLNLTFFLFRSALLRSCSPASL